MCDYSAVKKPCFSNQIICQKSIDILLGYSFIQLSKVCNLYPREAANDVFGKQSTSWSELRVHLCGRYKARVFVNCECETVTLYTLVKPESPASEQDAYGFALLEILEQRAKFGYRVEIIQKFMIKKAEPEERLAFAKRLYQEQLTTISM